MKIEITDINYSFASNYQPLNAKLTAYAGGDTPSAFTLGIVDSVDAAAWRTAIGAGTSSTSGTVTTTGSPASGNLTKFSGATSVTNGDLSGDVTTGGTLVTTLSSTGVSAAAYGSATQVGQFTVDVKGRLTAAGNVTITPAASSITGGAAITKTDDTNVTLTLGGTPTSAVLTATSFTLGWTGTLSVARGGTGVGTMTANALPKGNGTSAYTASNVSDDGSTVSIATGVGLSIAKVAVTSPAAADGNVYSGTYTPTLTNVANITGSTAYVSQYIRVGNVVTVSGKADIQATAITTNTRLGISLPIASNFANDFQAGGSGAPFGANSNGRVAGDATNDRAEFSYIAVDTNNRGFSYSFTYLIV